MFTAVIFVSALVQGLVALFVLLKNPKHLTNILYFFLSVSLTIWAVINFVLTNSTVATGNITLFRSLMSAVVIQNTFFYFFAHTYPHNSLNLSRKKIVSFFALSFLAFMATMSPFLFVSLEYSSGTPRPITGPGMLVFIAHALVSNVFGVNAFIKKYKAAKGIFKRQLRLMLAGVLILWTIVPITNFVLSLATKTLFFARISPIYALAFSSIIAYAIIAQKLFDIRAAVARASAYVLSLGTIVGTYGVIIFGISERFFQTTSSIGTQRAFYVGFAVLSSLFYQPIKKFFDRLTNRIFFQDAYEPQVFLDELNEVLVVNIELTKLLTDTVGVIEKNLKTNFCVFSLRETSYFPRRIIGDTTKRFEREDIEEIGKDSIHLHEKVIVMDTLEDNDRELKKTLDKNDIAVLVRLVATLEYEVEGIGYILFGAKKSGNAYSKQDIQTLEIIANELVIAIQNGLRFEEIEKFNATLQAKIDDATHRLQKTNEKLKALDETKDEFISMASHQLRTPLTSVKGYLSMVLEGDAGDVTEMQHKLLDQAYTSSQRMVYLIADLLNVSRLRTGKFVIETVPTNLAEVVEGEANQLKQTAKARGLDLTYDKPAEFSKIMLDETKIRQVIMNFMDNAIYYSRPNGKIEVAVKETDKTVEYSVRDNGIGVPKSEQHHLFTKFYRANNAKKARPDGTGLGLFMAKKVIVEQGGTLIFDSEEGKGSTFGFSFSKEKLAVPETTVTPLKP